MKKPKKPRRWRKDFPYFKIQLFSKLVNSWMDEQKAYPSVEEARAARVKKFPGELSRIVVVESNGRRILQE
jgi:hypothetical protein